MAFGSAGVQASEVTPSPQRYSFYTPDLHLISESSTSVYTDKPIAYEYIWFAGQPVAEVTAATATTTWTFTDHLGTPIRQTDTSGTITWSVEHDPYGNVYNQQAGASVHQPLRLPGQEAEQLTLPELMNGATERSYNIFRWYRSTWGRYTQGDRYLPVRWREPNTFAYVGDAPTRFADPKGLFRIDDTCDCPMRLTNVPKTIYESCKYIKNPKCSDLAHKYSMVPFYGKGTATVPLDQCLKQRCSDAEHGKGPLIVCSNDPNQCGWTTPGGDIVLYRGNTACPRINQVNGPNGTGPFGTRDYSQTLFHETIHTCGWGAIHSNEFLELSRVCTGWE